MRDPAASAERCARPSRWKERGPSLAHDENETTHLPPRHALAAEVLDGDDHDEGFKAVRLVLLLRLLRLVQVPRTLLD